MFFLHRLFPGATRSPETARPLYVSPTQQPPRSPAKERASQPNSARDDFSKLPSRRRQINTTFSVGSTVDRSSLDRGSVESPCLCVIAFFSDVVLLCYYCTYMVGSWVVDGWAFCCTLLYCCTIVHTWWVIG